jgi:hypothetical protein
VVSNCSIFPILTPMSNVRRCSPSRNLGCQRRILTHEPLVHCSTPVGFDESQLPTRAATYTSSKEAIPMRAVLIAAALIACASVTGCHHLGRRHGDGCQTCGPTCGPACGHHGKHGGLFRKKNSDMCDVCAATEAHGNFGGPSGPYGPNDAAGGVYGPHAAASAVNSGAHGGFGDGYAAGGAGPGNYPVRGTPGYPHHHYQREYIGPQGPSTAQTAYPYYTVRGPRDFFQNNPPSIGR